MLPFFNAYPPTNFHELNLDWVIAEIKKLHAEWNEYTIVNHIQFFGQWDITKQYPAYAIVNDNGFGYISTKPVPKGITLDNNDYWVMVANYDILIADLQNRVVALESELPHKADKPLLDKKVCIVGDQTIDEYWTNLLVSEYGASEVYIHEQDDVTFVNGQLLALCNTLEADSDYILICAGHSDWFAQIELGNRTEDINPGNNMSTFIGSVNATTDYLINNYPNSKIFGILPLGDRRGMGELNYDKAPTLFYDMLHIMYNHRGIGVIDLYNITCFKPWQNVYYNKYCRNYAYPNEAFAPILADTIAKGLSNNISNTMKNNDSVYNYVSNAPSFIPGVDVVFERFYCNKQLTTFIGRYDNFDITIPATDRFTLMGGLPHRLRPYAMAPVTGYAQVTDAVGHDIIRNVSGFIFGEGIILSIEGTTDSNVHVARLCVSSTYPVFLISHN